MFLIGGWLNIKGQGEVHTLNLDTFEWEYVGNTHNSKQFHTSNLFKDNIYIFGGADFDGFDTNLLSAFNINNYQAE